MCTSVVRRKGGSEAVKQSTGRPFDQIALVSSELR